MHIPFTPANIWQWDHLSFGIQQQCWGTEFSSCRILTRAGFICERNFKISSNNFLSQPVLIFSLRKTGLCVDTHADWILRLSSACYQWAHTPHTCYFHGSKTPRFAPCSLLVFSRLIPCHSQQALNIILHFNHAQSQHFVLFYLWVHWYGSIISAGLRTN